MYDFCPTPSSVKFNNYISALNFKTHLCCCNTPSSEKQKKKEARSRLFKTRVSLAPQTNFVKYVKLCKMCNSLNSGSFGRYPFFIITSSCNWGVHLFQDFPFV